MGLYDRDYGRRSGAAGGGGWSGGSGFGSGSGGEQAGAGGGGGILRLLNASFPIATILGIRVRFHITFVILLVIELMVEGNPLFTLEWNLLLFGSVLLHEFGHCLACRSVGGQADEILMWPLGGLAYCLPPRAPWPHFVTVVWGPLVNLFIAAGAYLALRLWLGPATPVGFNPWSPWIGYPQSELATWLSLLFVVNYYLMLFNLALVFYPFDGGRIVQVVLWAFLGYVRSMRVATALGMIGAIAVGLIGLATNRTMLAIIAIFGFMTCLRQRQALSMMGDFDEGDWRVARSVSPRRPGVLTRMAENRARKARQRQVEQSQRIDREVDRILAKIHDSGIGSLTAREKRVLEESARER